jgi:hypothetical protein
VPAQRRVCRRASEAGPGTDEPGAGFTREKALEKAARYEAHLSRQLYKATHELEALQARRKGGSAPLARLDVQGLSES